MQVKKRRLPSNWVDNNRRQRQRRDQARLLLEQGKTPENVAKKLGYKIGRNTVLGKLLADIRQRSYPVLSKHRVIIDGRLYIDRTGLSLELGTSKYWLTALIKKSQVQPIIAFDQQWRRLRECYPYVEIREQIKTLLKSAAKRDSERKAIKEYLHKIPGPKGLSSLERSVLFSLVTYKIEHGGRDPRIAWLTSINPLEGVTYNQIREALIALEKKDFIVRMVDLAETGAGEAAFYWIDPRCPPELITKPEECPHGVFYRRTYDFVRRFNGHGTAL